MYLVRSKLNGHFYAMKLVDKEFIIKYKKAGIFSKYKKNSYKMREILWHSYIIHLLLE